MPRATIPPSCNIDPQNPPSAQDLMKAYDKDEQEGLQTPEFSKMCWDLMGGEGMTEEFFTRLVTEEFFHADSDHDGQVSMDEFQVYYWSRLRFFFPVNPTAYSSSGHAADSFRDLWQYFVGYASRGYPTRREKMTCVSFLRLVKACGLLKPPKLTEANATIAFLEAWAKSLNEDIDIKKMSVAEAKKRTVLLDYKQFLFALKNVAQRRGLPLDKVIEQVLNTKPPKVPSSSMDFVRFAPDDNTAPSMDDEEMVDLSTMSVDAEGPEGERIKSLMESVRLSPSKGSASPSTSASLTAGELRSSLTYRGRQELGPVNLLPRLKDVFQTFCMDGTSSGGLMSLEPGEMRKLLEKSKLWGGAVDTKSVQDIFRGFSTTSIHFYQFQEALKVISSLRRISLNEAVEQVIRELHPQGLAAA